MRAQARSVSVAPPPQEDLPGYEFFVAILWNDWGRVKLPDMFARPLDSRGPQKMHATDCCDTL